MDHGTADHVLTDLHEIARKLELVLEFQRKLEKYLPLLEKLTVPGWMRGGRNGRA